MKRVLFISYYFPPSGGPGVQRTLKFVKYLPQFGWQPTVLTVDPQHAAYPSLDDTLEAEVPADVEVIRTAAWDPYAGYARLLGKRRSDAISVSFTGEGDPGPRERLARWIRANLFIPDARLGWVPFALRRARKLLERSCFDAVITTGPPHSTHLIGLRLVRTLNGALPWLADFRDPWSKIDYQQDLPTTPLAAAVQRKMERRVLSRASRVAVVTPTIQESFRDEIDRHYDVVMNGFDPADFGDQAVERDPEGLVIRHIGNMPAARNPEALWKALSRLDESERRAVRVELVGSVDPVVSESAARYAVSSHVSEAGYVNHTMAIHLMKSAEILLLVINNVEGAAGIMTGKLFEYFAAGRPVLGIGPTAGDAAKAIEQVSAGRLFAYEDVEGVTDFVRACISARKRGEGMEGASWQSAQTFSRLSRTRQLSGILSEMVEARAPARSHGEVDA